MVSGTLTSMPRALLKRQYTSARVIIPPSSCRTRHMCMYMRARVPIVSWTDFPPARSGLATIDRILGLLLGQQW